MVETGWCPSLLLVLLFVALYLCCQLQLVPEILPCMAMLIQVSKQPRDSPLPTFQERMSFQNNVVLLLQLSLGHRICVCWWWWGEYSYQLVLLMPICPSLPLAEELVAFMRILLCWVLALFMARLRSNFLRYMKSMTTWSCAVQPLTVIFFSWFPCHCWLVIKKKKSLY